MNIRLRIFQKGERGSGARIPIMLEWSTIYTAGHDALYYG